MIGDLLILTAVFCGGFKCGGKFHTFGAFWTAAKQYAAELKAKFF